jgi:hypothetical protein
MNFLLLSFIERQNEKVNNSDNIVKNKNAEIAVFISVQQKGHAKNQQ